MFAAIRTIFRMINTLLGSMERGVNTIDTYAQIGESQAHHHAAVIEQRNQAARAGAAIEGTSQAIGNGSKVKAVSSH